MSRRMRGDLSLNLDGLVPEDFIVEGTQPTLRAGAYFEYQGETTYRSSYFDYGALMFTSFRF